MVENCERDVNCPAPVVIRPYRDEDEEGWLRCSALSFLHTSYFDSVFRRRPAYDGPAIQLVAELAGRIVGVIDVECEEAPGTVCTVCVNEEGPILGGMLWHLAVHPDFQRQGIGGRMLAAARREAAQRGIACFEVWTRDDPGTLRWYETHGFTWVKRYLHVYLEGKEEVAQVAVSSMPGLRPVQVFAHYTGADVEGTRQRFQRTHDCNCYRLWF